MKRFNYIFSSFFLLLSFTNRCYTKVADLPDYITKCSRSIPEEEFNECFRSSIESALKSLKNGDPSINIDKIDPLQVSEISLIQDNGPVSVKLIQKNVDFLGLSEGTKVLKASLDFKENRMDISLYNPKSKFVADQEVDGRILIIPLKRKGKATFSVEDFYCNFTVYHDTYEKNGYHFWKPLEDTARVTIGMMKMSLSYQQLHENGKLLGNFVSPIFNENWKLIFAEFKPAYEQTYRSLIIQYLTRFYSKVPEENMFLD